MRLERRTAGWITPGLAGYAQEVGFPLISKRSLYRDLSTIKRDETGRLALLLLYCKRKRSDLKAVGGG